jgi:hypothetical protein
MEVSGYFHTLVSLTPGKPPGIYGKKEKYLVPVRKKEMI